MSKLDGISKDQLKIISHVVSADFPVPFKEDSLYGVSRNIVNRQSGALRQNIQIKSIAAKL